MTKVDLDTRPLTAEQLREILIAAHSRLADVFGPEARGQAWRKGFSAEGS